MRSVIYTVLFVTCVAWLGQVWAQSVSGFRYYRQGQQVTRSGDATCPSRDQLMRVLVRNRRLIQANCSLKQAVVISGKRFYGVVPRGKQYPQVISRRQRISDRRQVTCGRLLRSLDPGRGDLQSTAVRQRFQMQNGIKRPQKLSKLCFYGVSFGSTLRDSLGRLTTSLFAGDGYALYY